MLALIARNHDLLRLATETRERTLEAIEAVEMEAAESALEQLAAHVTAKPGKMIARPDAIRSSRRQEPRPQRLMVPATVSPISRSRNSLRFRKHHAVHFARNCCS
jgi:hypothetical protein